MPTARESHQVVIKDDTMYVFGGQDIEEKLKNDLFTAKIIEKELPKGKTFWDHCGDRFTVLWSQLKQPAHIGADRALWPLPRSSHTFTLFQNRYLVIIGGETPQEIKP